MSMAELALHEKKIAEDLSLLAEMYDRRQQLTHELLVYKSVYEKCQRYNCLMIGEHPIVCGGTKRKKSRKIQEAMF